MDQNIGMGRYRPVVGPAARLCQNIGAAVPMLQIITSVNPQSLPWIGNHPVMMLKEEDIGAFMRAVRNLRPARSPVIKIFAVRRIGMTVMNLIFIPHFPDTIRTAHHAGVYHPV